MKKLLIIFGLSAFLLPAVSHASFLGFYTQAEVDQIRNDQTAQLIQSVKELQKSVDELALQVQKLNENVK